MKQIPKIKKKPKKPFEKYSQRFDLLWLSTTTLHAQKDKIWMKYNKNRQGMTNTGYGVR